MEKYFFKKHFKNVMKMDNFEERDSRSKGKTKICRDKTKSKTKLCFRVPKNEDSAIICKKKKPKGKTLVFFRYSTTFLLF